MQLSKNIILRNILKPTINLSPTRDMANKQAMGNR